MATSLGVIPIRTPDEVTAEMAERENEQAAIAIQSEPPISSLGAHIMRDWDTARTSRNDITENLLRCLRQRKGEYDPETLGQIRASGAGSEIYMKVTNTKCRAIETQIRTVLTATGDRPWDLKPTPIAELNPQSTAAIENKVAAATMQMLARTGRQPTPAIVREIEKHVREDIKNQVQMEAERIADKMRLKIHDQLTEGGWRAALDECIVDITTFPLCVMEGPIIRQSRRMGWQQDPATGRILPVPMNKIIPVFERVSPFDFYPVNTAAETPNKTGIVRIMTLTAATLQQLIGVEGYQEGAIRLALNEMQGGGMKDWLFRPESSQRQMIEGDTSHAIINPSDTAEAIVYWNHVYGRILREWGLTRDEITGTDIDPVKVYQIKAIMIGKYVIYAQLNPNPLGNKPFYTASFDKIPGSMYGLGPPELIRDIQAMCNSAARNIENNAAIASGPQLGIDTSSNYMSELIINKNDDIVPWAKRYYADQPGYQRPPIEFYQPDSRVHELMLVFQFFLKLADDATGAPPYMYGDPRVSGAGKTMGGLNMLIGMASRGIKTVIANIDGYGDNGIIEPSVKAMWLFNMLHDEDQSIKGDIEVVAQGARHLMVREEEANTKLQLLQFLGNPMDAQLTGLFGRVRLLREVLQAHDIDPDKVLMTDEQIQRVLAESQQRQQQMMKAQAQQQGGGSQQLGKPPQSKAAA